MAKNAQTERIAELEADNRRLRRLLELRDAPAELRHRTRGAMALLRSIIRFSAEQATDLENYVAHLLDRLDAVSRAQAAADTYGHVDFRSLLTDQLLHYCVQENGRLRLTGPEVQFCARPAQMLALAMEELAVNAIEHGALGAESGTLDISWCFAEGGREFVCVWKESGVSGMVAPTHHGFGTQTLIGLLQYELGARTTLDWEADGLRCTMRLSWSEKIGSAGEASAASPGLPRASAAVSGRTADAKRRRSRRSARI